MQILVSSQQSHTGDEPDQTKIMVSVQVGNENVINAASADLVFVHLGLGTLTTVHQEQMVVQGDDLGRRMTIESR